MNLVLPLFDALPLPPTFCKNRKNSMLDRSGESVMLIQSVRRGLSWVTGY